MKLKKILSFLFFLLLCNTTLYAETKTDCSKLKSDTAVKIYEKWKCSQDNPDSEGLGKKIKNLFKKKN